MLSALYQISNNIGAAYGHELPLPLVDEFVKFDGVVRRDGIHGRGEGAIYRRWYDGATGDVLIKKHLLLLDGMRLNKSISYAIMIRLQNEEKKTMILLTSLI